MYYFGCKDQAGHYMWNELNSVDWDFLHNNPWGIRIDGLNRNKPGIHITWKDGWTVISMTDNSVDTRPGSNSAFLEKGQFNIVEMVKMAHEKFPAIAQRIGLKEP